MNSKRKIVVGVVSLVAVVVIAAVTVLVIQMGRRQADTRSDVATSHEQADPQEGESENPDVPKEGLPAFTQANATTLEKAMESRDKEEQAKALIPALRDGSWKPSDILPDGASIEIDRASFKPGANGEATVNAAVDGSVQAEFVLSLAFVNDEGWLISTTKQK